MYREFVLRSPAVWKALVSVVKANAKACADKGTPLRVILTSEEQKRNPEQNRRLWGHLYKQIAEQAWINGRQYDAEVWHEMLARKFGVCDDFELPTGEVVVVRRSTTKMSVHEFTEYMDRVEAYAATELGVVFE